MSKAKSNLVSAVVASILDVLLVISVLFLNDRTAQWLWPGDGPWFVLNLAFAWFIAFLILRKLLMAGPAPSGNTARTTEPAATQPEAGSAPSRLKPRLAAFFQKVVPARWTRRDVLRSAALMLVVWVPVLLFTWPGSSSPDTINMLYQYASSGPKLYWTLGTVTHAAFINHHPVLDSLICGIFWEFGGLFGDHAWGFFFFSLVNFAFASVILGALVCYAGSKLAAPRGLVVGAQLFFMFFPAFPLFFSYMSKDAIFVPWFMLWVLLFVDRWRTGGTPSIGRWIAFVLVSVMCILTKQLALYLIAPSVLVLAVHLRGAKTRAIVLSELAATLALALAVFPAVVYPMVGGVEPGGKQEILGTPLNQAVTLYEEQPEAFSKQEKKVLNRVVYLDYITDHWEEISAFKVDGVKDQFRPNAKQADIMAFLELWVAKGLEYPEYYFASSYVICMPFFMPTQGIAMNSFTKQSFLDKKKAFFEYAGLDWTDLDLHQPEVFQDNQAAVHQSLTVAAETPIIGLFFTIGFYSGWLPLLCFIALALRRPRTLWAMSPLILFWLLQILNPAALTRYAMPLIALAPFYLAWTRYLIAHRGESDEEESRAGSLPA